MSSSDVGPRKRFKDKKHSAGELNPPSNLPKKLVLDETIHVQKDVHVGGNIFSKLIFVSVLLLLGLSLMYMLSQNDVREGSDGDNTGVTRWLIDLVSSNYFWSKEKEQSLTEQNDDIEPEEILEYSYWDYLFPFMSFIQKTYEEPESFEKELAREEEQRQSDDRTISEDREDDDDNKEEEDREDDDNNKEEEDREDDDDNKEEEDREDDDDNKKEEDDGEDVESRNRDPSSRSSYNSYEFDAYKYDDNDDVSKEEKYDENESSEEESQENTGDDNNEGKDEGDDDDDDHYRTARNDGDDSEGSPNSLDEDSKEESEDEFNHEQPAKEDQTETSHVITKLGVGVALIFVAYTVIIRKWNNYVDEEQAASIPEVENVLHDQQSHTTRIDLRRNESETSQEYLETPSASESEDELQYSPEGRMMAHEIEDSDSYTGTSGSDVNESDIEPSATFDRYTSGYNKANVTNEYDWRWRDDLDDADEDFDRGDLPP